MDKKWLRGIHALEQTIDALWQLVAQFPNNIEDVMGLTIEEDRAKDHMGRVVRFAMVFKDPIETKKGLELAKVRISDLQR
ncbi:hypothetical protein JHK82_043145 [Glycine max]|nr:hypothetical protein JHK82_043145 [Glycine max]